MIKARMDRPGHSKGPVVLLGVDARNVERLKAGRPLLVDLSELLPGVRAELSLMYGETLVAIADELASHGLEIPSAERERLAEIDATPNPEETP